MFYKETTKKETRKYSTNPYVTALSNTAVKKVERRDGRQRKDTLYMFEAKEGKQYHDNDTENLFVVIIYLISL